MAKTAAVPRLAGDGVTDNAGRFARTFDRLLRRDTGGIGHVPPLRIGGAGDARA
jgi:hypothetical protein